MNKKRTERDDKTYIEVLHYSIARIAQAANIETEKLPVLNKTEEELVELCITQRTGWVDLTKKLEREFKWVAQSKVFEV
jgi:hypothetical protein